MTTSQLARFQIATEARRELQSLSSSMLHYVLTRDPKQWAQFEKASGDLNQWIDNHDPTMNPKSPLTTAAERSAFVKLNQVYDDYLAAADGVHTNAHPQLVSPGQLAQLERFEGEADRIRGLVRELSEAHRSAEAGFFANATASLEGLRNALVISVALLLVFVAALAGFLYRDLVAPLRSSLVRSQALLERSEKLAVLGTLTAGIAHEIRNPLTSLKARLFTLEKRLVNLPAARKDTEIINGEISRLERIVQDALSFAQPAEPKLQILEVDELLLELQRLMTSNQENRGVTLRFEHNSGLWIRADGGYMKQVLINLMRNAREAINGEGTITLRALARRSSVEGQEIDAVVLEVADTGKGITPEVAKRLFDPFFSTKETGTGLGLSISARLVEKQGGFLQYVTRLGQGTTFGIVLPSVKPPVA